VSGERPLPTLRGLRTGAIAAAILLTALLTAAAADAAPTGLPDRDADPVVLTGADVPGLEGVEPGSIVAFKYDGRWRQIPVQVDERAMIDYKAVRQTTSFGTSATRPTPTPRRSPAPIPIRPSTTATRSR
jgi:hypothetical protein